MTRWLTFAAVVACGQPPAPIAPPPAPPVVVPLDAPADSRIVDTAAIDATVDAAEPLEPVSARCRGGAIVSSISEPDPCATRHPPEPLPDSVTLSLEPDPLVMRAGGDGSAQLVLSNRGSGDIELYLDDERQQWSSPDYEIDDGSGNRADLVGYPCAALVALIPHTLHVAVPSHGRTSFAFTVHARVLRANGGCGRHPVGPLAPGRYALVVDTLRGVLVVR